MEEEAYEKDNDISTQTGIIAGSFIIQSNFMSRVAHCIDNGPMEGFWGILKREMYYGKRFTSKTDLNNAIESYIHYYNTERIQRNLHLMTPVEYHENYHLAA